jgi:hypothetical protein
MAPWLAVDTWTTGTFTVNVLAAPDGSHVAVSEYGGPSSTLNRVRIVSATGEVEWQPDAPMTADNMAWSPDSTKLAIETVPNPWTVVTLRAGGSAAVRYDLGTDAAYRLIGFTRDGAHLVGYQSDGEAGFADHPVSLDVTPPGAAPARLDAFPAGMASNATTTRILDRINDRTGDALTITSDATSPTWVVRHNGVDTPLGGFEPSDAAWADGATIVLEAGDSPPVPPVPCPSPGSAANPDYRGIETMAGPGAPHVPQISYPAPVPGIAPTGIVAARDGAIVVFSGPSATCHGPANPYETAMHVFNVHTRSLLTANRPADLPREATLLFGGWLPASRP